DHDDAALQRLMTNLGGHDLASVLDAFHAIADDRPTCFIAYTIKGHGLPFAVSGGRWHEAAAVAVPPSLPVPRGERQSTQEAFGRLLGDIAAGDSELADR